MSNKLDLDKLRRDIEERTDSYDFNGNEGVMKEHPAIILKLLDIIQLHETFPTEDDMFEQMDNYKHEDYEFDLGFVEGVRWTQSFIKDKLK